MDLTRRDFTQGLMAAAAFLAASGTPLKALAGITPLSNGRFLMGAENELVVFHLADNRVQRIPLGFNTHGVFPHPTDPNRVWTVEKVGTHAAEVDLNSGAVTKTFKSPDNALFYGHAAYQPESDTLFVACMRYEDRSGHLVGYDTQDYIITSDDYMCSGPMHDVQFMPDGRLMVATMEIGWTDGSPVPVTPNMRNNDPSWYLTGSAICIFNPHTRERLRTLPIEDGRTQALTHMHLLKNGGLIAIAAPWDYNGVGAFYFAANADTPLARVNCGAALEKNFKYEFLSIAVDDRGHMAAVTNPIGGHVVFIDTRTGAFRGAVHDHFTNVAFDASSQQFMAALSGQIVPISPKGIAKPLVSGLQNAMNKPLQFSSAHSIII